MRKKNVLIVGAGPCGLVALKEMREAGHNAISIERGKHVGGVFARDSAIAYDTLYLTTSNFLIAFSDFPPLEPRPKYTSKQEYGRYLESYAEHFELLPHIKFETTVKEAVFDRDKKLWTIKVESQGMVDEHIVDGLVVASGAYQVSSQPMLEGYTGEILHSKNYRNCKQDLTGKRALVLGTGESAVDIAGEFAEAGAETIVYSRRPFMMGPRFPFKAMFDRNYDEMKILTEQHEDNDQACAFLEALATNRIGQLAPLYLFSWLRRMMLIAGSTGILGKNFKLASTWALFGARRYPSRADQAAVVTKNGRLFTHAAENRVHMVVSDKVIYEGHKVTFSCTRLHNAEVYETPKNVEFENVDIVVCCTGFMTKFDWLEHGNIKVDPRSWYKHSYVPGYDGQLMILGYARPHQGGIPPCAEMLARYGALLLSGERTLPDDYAQRAKEQGMIESNYYAITSHILAQVDYPSFMNSLAQLIGCTPKSPNVLTSPTRAFQYWFYPNWPCWYRQRGHGANTAALNAFLNKVPLRNSLKLSHSGPFFVAEIILLILSQPLYLLAFLLSPIFKSHRSGMTPGWLFLKPKSQILHGDEPIKSKAKDEPVMRV